MTISASGGGVLAMDQIIIELPEESEIIIELPEESV